MIYEVRTYTFKPGVAGRWLANFSLANKTKYSFPRHVHHQRKSMIAPRNKISPKHSELKI